PGADTRLPGAALRGGGSGDRGHRLPNRRYPPGPGEPGGWPADEAGQCCRGRGAARRVAPPRLLAGAGGGSVLLAELVYAAGSVDDLLLARIERMAARADFHLQVMSERGARLERIAAGAADRDLCI